MWPERSDNLTCSLVDPWSIDPSASFEYGGKQHTCSLGEQHTFLTLVAGHGHQMSSRFLARSSFKL